MYRPYRVYTVQFFSYLFNPTYKMYSPHGVYMFYDSKQRHVICIVHDMPLIMI